MKKSIVILMGICVVAVSVLAWAVFVKPEPVSPVPPPVNGDTSDWKTYQNEEFGFEIRYPEIYSVEDISKKAIGDDPTKYPWYSRTGFALSYIIFDEYPTSKGGVAFDLKILNTIDKDKIKSAGGWESIKENGVRKIGDLDIYLYSIDFRTNNMQVIFHNDKSYTFFHYLSEEDFEKIISTFKFTE